MAFSTTGWRRIVVNDQIYYWQTDEWSADLLLARPEREPHRLLRITSQCGRGGFLRGVTPGVVRAAIECALEHGWLQERPRLRLTAFTDPLRYVGPQAHWLTPTVVQLAQGIDADRAFDRMPILADALQEAGCDNDDVLNHCRNPGPHVRGCWVVDLLLGKS